jgi:ethanolamine utilization protein EutQ (cupin superfamily)
MPRLIAEPIVIAAAGSPPKVIEEFVGRVSTQVETVSIARMKAPAGWVEPGQTPEFDECTLVLDGTVRVEFEGGSLDAKAGQTVWTKRGEWVRYSTPTGAEYVAVCVPAFSPQTVHRDE